MLGVGAFKRINLLCHGKLPFRIIRIIPIRSRLKGNRKTIVTRRVAIRWTTMASKNRRSHVIRGTRRIRRRNIGGSIRDIRSTGIMEGKMRQ
jgi:hypothetical protein